MKLSYETERLLLKVLDENDSKRVLDYIIRNKEFLKEFEPKREEKFYTIEFQIRQLRNDLKYIKNRSMLKLWIFSKNQSDKIIGEITFYNIVPFAFLSCHVGYKSDKDQARTGIMTEALKEGIKIMFKEYGMHRIEAHVMPNNKASIRLLGKAGFIYEGISHKFLEVNGIWEDHIHFTLINDEL